MPNEDEHWITTSNGQKVLIDGEGTVLAGMGGTQNGKDLGGLNKEPATETAKTGAQISESGGIKYSKTLEKYKEENGGDHYIAAREFYRNELQGKSIKCQTTDGEKEAFFTGGTWQELKRDLKGDKLKAELIPLMPDKLS